ncbi:PINIT domain-containing protein [Blakeslea trispora]|nr:PINIT domain-containing protein [Blakeslea trispora]
MSSQSTHLIEADLRKATCKELADCIKALNSHPTTQSRLAISGRKSDLISRLVNYILSLTLTTQYELLETVVQIINSTKPEKFCWQVKDEQLYTNNTRRLIQQEVQEVDHLDFKPSPFFQPVVRLTQIKICPIADRDRQAKSFQFTLTDSQRSMLATPNAVDDRPPYQIRFYCTKYSTNPTQLSVEFPAICELKVNGTVISGSVLRCLKNKPGTVNPPDVTIMTRKTALNTIELVYVNSDVPFMASVFIVKRTPVPTLIGTLKRDHVMPKEETLDTFQKIQQDAELIMESETLALKDPLAFTRIVTPIRSKHCRHLQCYDAHIFLTMNEQTPTWSCPVCNKQMKDWTDLIVDEYFAEILKETPRHVDSVRIEPNGQITIITENDDSDLSESDTEQEQPEKPTETITLDSDDEQAHHAIAGDPIVVQPLREEIPAKKRQIPTDVEPEQKRTKHVIDLTLESEEEEENVVESEEEEENVVESEEEEEQVQFVREYR